MKTLNTTSFLNDYSLFNAVFTALGEAKSVDNIYKVQIHVYESATAILNGLVASVYAGLETFGVIEHKAMCDSTWLFCFQDFSITVTANEAERALMLERQKTDRPKESGWGFTNTADTAIISEQVYQTIVASQRRHLRLFKASPQGSFMHLP